MGDLWPNSVFIHAETHQLWVLDWEMARWREPLSDCHQLMANLWLMMGLPHVYHKDRVKLCLTECLNAFHVHSPDVPLAGFNDYAKLLFIAYVLLILDDVKDAAWPFCDNDKVQIASRALRDVDTLFLK
jgi:hypothetical protein